MQTIEERLDQLEKRRGLLTVGSIAMMVAIAIQFSACGDDPAGPSTSGDDPAGPSTDCGELSVDQDLNVSVIEIVLRDDSPEDGVGGTAFFLSDVHITYKDGTVVRGSEIDFAPAISGGFVQEGFLSADGTEEIRLRYDFDSEAFVNKEEIKKVEFRLELGNDYQVWVTSDNQLNASGESVLLLVAQAEGNVQDNTNLQMVGFNYERVTSTQKCIGPL